MAFAIIIGLISLVIGLILFYVGSRLQLVLVELVATRQTMVAPVWRRVGQATWRWIAPRLLLLHRDPGAGTLLAAPVVVEAARHHAWPSFDMFHIGEIVLLIVAALALLLIAVAGYLLLRDFALPHIGLEDVSIPEALSRLRMMVADEPGEIALYLLAQKFLLILVFTRSSPSCALAS